MPLGQSSGRGNDQWQPTPRRSSSYDGYRRRSRSEDGPPAEDAEDVTMAMEWMNGILYYAVFRGNQGTAPLGMREYLTHSGAARGRRKRDPRAREPSQRAHQRRNHALGQANGIKAHAGSGASRRKARGKIIGTMHQTAAGRAYLRPHRLHAHGPRRTMTARRQPNVQGRAHEGATAKDGDTGASTGAT